MFDLRKIIDLLKIFAVPKDFLKSKIYCNNINDKISGWQIDWLGCSTTKRHWCFKHQGVHHSRQDDFWCVSWWMANLLEGKNHEQHWKVCTYFFFHNKTETKFMLRPQEIPLKILLWRLYVEGLRFITVKCKVRTYL